MINHKRGQPPPSKPRPTKWLKVFFFALIVKPLVLIGLGLNLIGKNNLPQKGPAIMAANHTSHLDTLVLMSLFPLRQVSQVRPVAAADYFLKNRWIRWFSIHCLDIIPMRRLERVPPDELFRECYQALERGEILILFPEGTRALTEEREFKLKRGLHYLHNRYPHTQVIPIILRGLGKALPKGEALLVPFNCDVIIDKPLAFSESSKDYLEELKTRYHQLLARCLTK